MAVSLRLAVEALSWKPPGGSKPRKHLEGSDICIVLKGVIHGELVLQVYQNTHIMETIEVSRKIDASQIVARREGHKLAFKLQLPTGEESSIMFVFTSESECLQLQKALEQRRCPFVKESKSRSQPAYGTMSEAAGATNKPSRLFEAAATACEPVSLGLHHTSVEWPQQRMLCDETSRARPLSSSTKINDASFSFESIADSPILNPPSQQLTLDHTFSKESARAQQGDVTSRTLDLSRMMASSNHTSSRPTSSATLQLPALPRPTLASRSSVSTGFGSSSQDKHMSASQSQALPAMLATTSDHFINATQCHEEPTDVLACKRQSWKGPTLQLSDAVAHGEPVTSSSTVLGAYAAQTDDARRFECEQFIMEKLQDPAFITLCNDLEKCWQRFVLKL